MKKLLFAAALVLGAMGAKAQTYKLTVTNNLTTPYYVDVFGNDVTLPDCDMNRNAGMTLVNPYGSSVTFDVSASPSFWLPSSVTTDRINHFMLGIDLGGGMWDYGTTRPDVCTGAPSGGTYNFFSSPSVNLTYNILGANWIEVVIN
jgi:hypothetical protein